MAVLVVSATAGEVGGLGGYAIGRRWGLRLVERPVIGLVTGTLVTIVAVRRHRRRAEKR